MIDSCRCRHRAGFALVDVTVAVIVLGVGVLGLSVAMNAVVMNMRAAERATRMAALAQSEAERLFATRHRHPSTGARDVAPYRVRWQESSTSPRELSVVVSVEGGARVKADTLVTVLPER